MSFVRCSRYDVRSAVEGSTGGIRRMRPRSLDADSRYEASVGRCVVGSDLPAVSQQEAGAEAGDGKTDRFL